MNYGNIKYYDISNGDGVRTSLFVSGCNHHCKGCFNEVAWDFDYGFPYTTETTTEILDSLEPEYISGLSVLGGEPLDPRNVSTVANLIYLTKLKYPEKTIWLYTGYTYEEIIQDLLFKDKYSYITILSSIDVLVDGKFDESLKDISLKFRGSSNQRIIDIKKSQIADLVLMYD